MSGRPELPLIERAMFASWRDHRGACERCQQVDPAIARTIVAACLDGTLMLKEAYNALWNADRAKRERRARQGAQP